jgi:hypothetical protein
MNLATAAQVFQVHGSLPNPNEDELLALLERSADIKAFLSDIETWVFRTIEKGRTLKGWKLVNGRSIRKWGVSEEDVKAFIVPLLKNTDDTYTKKIISPAQAEKKLGAKIKKDSEFQKLITKPEGKPTLVKETDKRPAIQYRGAQEIFADFT